MKKIIIFLIFVTMPTTLYAEPSTTVNYLIKEPASMFDLGMAKLEIFILRFKFPEFENEGIELRLHLPFYDWVENRIHIGVTADSKSDNPTKEICKIVTNEFKTRLGSDENGVVKSKRLHVGDFFVHSGYEIKGDPKNLVNEINQIVIIEVYANHTGKKMGKDFQFAKSVSSLMSDKILFVE